MPWEILTGTPNFKDGDRNTDVIREKVWNALTEVLLCLMAKQYFIRAGVSDKVYILSFIQKEAKD